MAKAPTSTEFAGLLARHLRLAALPDVPEIRLHLAHAGSGLRNLLALSGSDRPPYWAYAWGGGLALARHVLDHPETVRGRSVVDMGAGSGLVAIAAALAGARQVTAVEVDARAEAAIRLNAAANGVTLDILATGADERLRPTEVVLAGDVFYDPGPAAIMLPLLTSCRQSGADVLIGDPFRKPLPIAALDEIARYRVRDFGGVTGDAGVFRLKAP